MTDIDSLKQFVNRIESRNLWISKHELLVEMITLAQRFLIMYKYDGTDRYPLTPADSLTMMWTDLRDLSKGISINKRPAKRNRNKILVK